MNMELPPEYAELHAEEQLRTILEIWLRLHRTDPRLAGFTHARATIEQIGGQIRWSLLDADANGVRHEQDILLDSFGYSSIRAILAHYAGLAPSATKGRLTFGFDPPRVGLDLFDDENEPVFSRYVVDVDEETRANATASITTH